MICAYAVIGVVERCFAGFCDLAVPDLCQSGSQHPLYSCMLDSGTPPALFACQYLNSGRR
jgi:hypothetical protein